MRPAPEGWSSSRRPAAATLQQAPPLPSGGRRCGWWKAAAPARRPTRPMHPSWRSMLPPARWGGVQWGTWCCIVMAQGQCQLWRSSPPVARVGACQTEAPVGACQTEAQPAPCQRFRVCNAAELGPFPININMQQQRMLQLFKTQCNCPLQFEPTAWRKMSVWWTLVDGLVPVA